MIQNTGTYFVFELPGVLSRLERHLGGAHRHLRGELGGQIPREAHPHAAVGERLHHRVDVRRPRPGHPGESVLKMISF